MHRVRAEWVQEQPLEIKSSAGGARGSGGCRTEEMGTQSTAARPLWGTSPLRPLLGFC